MGLTASNEEIGPNTPGCTAMDSGHHARFPAKDAFKSEGWWGGRKDDKGTFYLGIACDATHSITSAEFEQFGGHVVSRVTHVASEVRVMHNDLVVATRSDLQAGESKLWQLEDKWYISADTSISGWAWDVRRLKFLTASNEEIGPNAPGCKAMDSGHHARFPAQDAFKSEGWWGGRKDDKGTFYLGIVCDATHRITSVEFEQFGGHVASEVRVMHNDLVVATGSDLQAGESKLWQKASTAGGSRRLLEV